MPNEKVLVTQTGADTSTAATIQTGLTVDGKTGWSVFAIEAYWADGSAVAAGDWSLSAYVNTTGTTSTPVQDDEIGRVSWGLQNTAGVAVAVPYDPQRSVVLIEPRVTVQPQIYAVVQSAATGQANDVVLIVYYEIVKLTDLEVLRLFAGGT